MSQSGEISAFLGPDTQFDGKLVFDGVVRLEGEFKGHVYGRDTLIIAEGANVNAIIEADTIVVEGMLSGEIVAHSKIFVKQGGHVKGSVKSPSIKIDEGGVVEGSTRMLDEEFIFTS